MSREYPLFRLRMAPELKEKLEASANANRRSLNSEIVLRLEKGLQQEGVSLSGYVTDEQKIYTIRPGKTTEPDPVKQGIDRLALRIAIETGERFMEDKGVELSAEKRALLFEILYDLSDGDDGQNKVVDNDTIQKLFELAS